MKQSPIRPEQVYSVTVVIPSFRGRDTIERAVKSALGQARVEIFVIVVVDDECDATRSTVENIGCPRVSVIANAKNMGAPFSRNIGLGLCVTDFVMFLDCDDFVIGDLLFSLADTLNHTNSDICLGPWIKLNEENNHCSRRVPKFISETHAFKSWLVEQASIPPCAVMWRTEFVRSIDGWDSTIARNQDGEIILRAILKGATISKSLKGSGVYCQHTSEYRITSGTNLFPLIEVAEKLLAIESDVVKADERRDIIGQYLYRNAKKAFRSGNLEFGRAALVRCKELGNWSNADSFFCRIGSTLLGPERYHKTAGIIKRRAAV